MSFSEKLNSIVKKFNDLENKLQDPSALGQGYAKISKEHSDMIPVVELIHEYQKVEKEIIETKEALEAKPEKDMKEMLEEELQTLTKKFPEIEKNLQI